MTVPAIFLDRDGVIIENRPNYVRTWSDVEFIESAVGALISISKRPYPIVVVTNQSAVSRGLITRSKADEINKLVIQEIEKAGGRIDAVYMCPHAPEDDCPCRKPKPGLMIQAAQEMDLDLARSIMVGDALSDIQAGRSAGIGQSFLVLTGRGKEQLSLPQAANLEPLKVFSDLEALIEDISDLTTSLF